MTPRFGVWAEALRAASLDLNVFGPDLWMPQSANLEHLPKLYEAQGVVRSAGALFAS